MIETGIMKTASKLQKKKTGLRRLLGFSLLEVLMAVAVVSCLAAAGYLVMTDVTVAAKSTKLTSDVATLNNAVRTYLTNGGQIPATATAQQVLDQLKKSSNVGTKARLAGIKGSMLDARLRGALVTAAGDDRAVWNASSQRFEIRSAGTGFRTFDLGADPTADFGDEERTRTLDLATKTNWVWDFEDGAPGRQTPTAVETTDEQVLEATGPASIVRLTAPDFSMPGGLYDFNTFAPTLKVSLVDRNVPGTARLFYSIESGPWIEYTGVAINIPRRLTTTLLTYAAAIDPESYEDSDPRTAKYETIYFTGTSAGNFHTPVGDAKLKTSIGPGEKKPEFKWGDSATNDKKQNELKFEGSSFSNIAPNEEFTLGKLEYYNGTTYSGTNATAVQIAIDLNLTTPGVRETLNFTFKLLSTPNNGKDADADADYVYIPDVSTTFRTIIKGKQFELVLRFGEHSANGFTTIDTFHAHEGKTLKGTIYGRLREVK